MIYLLLLLGLSISRPTAGQLPPAPYHFQLRCLSGRASPALSVCPQESTVCAHFYAPNGDSKGHYTCLDERAFEGRRDGLGRQQNFLVETCGATPGCSSLPAHSLTNASYARFSLSPEAPVKFCCSLFYNTLVKLVEDTAFAPKEPASMTCGGADCDTGAVGCLVYAQTRENIREEWIDRARRQKRQEAVGVKAVEVSFGSDEEDAERMELGKKSGQKGKKAEEREDFGEEEEEEEYSTEIVEYSEEDEEEDPIETSGSCVYRHLQDEYYKYCLLVHSKKEPLKCTAHLGYTVCCCFVLPGATTCDPTRVQRAKALPTLAPKPPTTSTVTPPPTTTTVTPQISSTETTTTSTTSSTTTTVSPPTTSAPAKCDVEYVRQLGGKSKAVLVCSSSYHALSSISLTIIVFIITSLLW